MGIRGCLANFFSDRTNTRIAALPKTIRHITVGEFHGNCSPPKSRPSRSMRVTPRMERLPAQSTALIPSITVVLGLCTSRNNIRTMNVVPQIATNIDQCNSS